MTIISFEKNFIFIKNKRTASTSLEIALSKYCGHRDIITPIEKVEEKIKEKFNFPVAQNYLYKNKPTKFNYIMFKDFILSCFKILPFAKFFFKFNYPPNFSLNRPLFIQNRLAREFASLNEVKKILDINFYNKCFKFTIIRNPYSQFMSFYRWMLFKHRYLFEAYSKYHNNLPQKKADDLIRARNLFIIKYKNFYEYAKKKAYFFFNEEKNRILDENRQLRFDMILRYENLQSDLATLSKKLNIDTNIYQLFAQIRAKETIGKGFHVDLDEKSRRIIYKNAKFIFDKFNYRF